MTRQTVKPATLADALTLASSYWDSKGASSRMMSTRASKCVSLLSSRTASLVAMHPTHGTALLEKLRREGLSKASVQSYYAAFRRMLKLAGVSTTDWPAPGNPPRKTREALNDADLERLHKALTPRSSWQGTRTFWDYTGRHEHRHITGNETADLLVLLKGTGMRVEVEALSWDAWKWDPIQRTLHITGKGGHERLIPVEDPACIALLGDDERLKAMRRISYSGHLKRWKLATGKLKVTTKLPTPHAVRHWWATKVYQGSGKDLKLVQELLGHADVGTTAGYIGVNAEGAREAVRRATT